MHHKRWLSGFAAVALAAAVAGCGSGTRQAAVAGSGVGRAEVEVVMQNTAFKPQKLEVKLGTAVRWVNKDQVDHSVWEGDPQAPSHLFHSTDFGNGGTFSYTFDKPGRYTVFCSTANHHLLGMMMEVFVK
jgi:plastocyanin